MGQNAGDPLADPPEQLRAFIRDGRITAMLAKRTRRLLLLDQVAQAFEPGRKYPEAAVDAVLKSIFDDHCTLRRHLVDVGLPPLIITAGLDRSASAHSQAMADGCGLSHQCPGEPSIGARETAAGVPWTACGENIGEGGSVADTTAAITQMAFGLTQDMLNEQPPDDGHRLNILSSSFTHIGIAVYRAPNGTVWLTQDFSN
jgi:uncharacterized protein YkwD